MRHLGPMVSALADGELDHDLRDYAFAHLALCDECREAVEAERSAKGAVAGAGAMAVPPRLAARLLAVPAAAPAPPGQGGPPASRPQVSRRSRRLPGRGARPPGRPAQGLRRTALVGALLWTGGLLVASSLAAGGAAPSGPTAPSRTRSPAAPAGLPAVGPPVGAFTVERGRFDVRRPLPEPGVGTGQLTSGSLSSVPLPRARQGAEVSPGAASGTSARR